MLSSDLIQQLQLVDEFFTPRFYCETVISNKNSEIHEVSLRFYGNAADDLVNEDGFYDSSNTHHIMKTISEFNEQHPNLIYQVALMLTNVYGDGDFYYYMDMERLDFQTFFDSEGLSNYVTLNKLAQKYGHTYCNTTIELTLKTDQISKTESNLFDTVLPVNISNTAGDGLRENPDPLRTYFDKLSQDLLSKTGFLYLEHDLYRTMNSVTMDWFREHSPEKYKEVIRPRNILLIRVRIKSKYSTYEYDFIDMYCAQTLPDFALFLDFNQRPQEAVPYCIEVNASEKIDEFIQQLNNYIQRLLNTSEAKFYFQKILGTECRKSQD